MAEKGKNLDALLKEIWKVEAELEAAWAALRMDADHCRSIYTSHGQYEAVNNAYRRLDSLKSDLGFWMVEQHREGGPRK